MIRRFEKYADYIVSSPDIAQLLSCMYYHIYRPIDTVNIRYNSTPNLIAVVIHAPTNPAIKGTTHIVEAVDCLKKEGYNFKFCLFEEMSNLEVREALSDADIAVDQLSSIAGGMFAMEAMSAGCAVLSGNAPEVSGHPAELPIIPTAPDNIYQNLKMLLDHPETRQGLGEKGRRYVETYHDCLKVADDFITEILTIQYDVRKAYSSV